VLPREIADAIGRGLKVPAVAISSEEAAQHFNFLWSFGGVGCPASSALTRQRLDGAERRSVVELPISIARAPSKPELHYRANFTINPGEKQK